MSALTHFSRCKCKGPGPSGPGPRARGAEESRTPDLFIANEALYQLSYRPERLVKDTRVGWAGRALALLGAALFTLLVGACSRDQSRPAGPLRVVVTVPPLVGLVKPLLPPDASITALMTPGKSEHGYEFSPKDIGTLGAADVVVYVGLGLEPAIESFLEKHPRAGRRDVCFASVAGMAVAERGHEEGHDHSHAVDPHLWLDPRLCLGLVDAVAKAIEPAGSGPAGEAAQKLKSQLESFDEEAGRLLAPLRGRAIVTHHNAWKRLADRYGLSIAAVIREFEGEPTPGAIAAAAEAIRKQGAKAVFVEPQFDPQAARRIAEAAGVRLGVLDPLGSGDYFAMMRGNIDALVKTLGE